MEVASLIAAFHKEGKLHAVHHVKSSPLTGFGHCQGWCGVEGGESPTVIYVPSWAFDGRDQYGDNSGHADVCISCSAALCALAVPP